MIPTEEDIPYTLMPLAVLFLAYIVVSMTVSLLVFWRFGKTPQAHVIVSILIASLLYSYTIGSIQGAFAKVEHAKFDPLAVLELSADQAKNTTIVQQVYKTKLQYYHPSNSETGNAEQLQQVMYAFQALNDEVGQHNYQQHGHPAGPLLTNLFQWQIPEWLFVWNERVQTLMMVAYASIVAALVGAIVYTVSQNKQQAKAAGEDVDDDDYTFQSNSVAQRDLEYLANHVRPDLTHIQVLTLALASPTNLAWAKRDLQKVEKLRAEKLQEQSSSKDPAQKRSTIQDFETLVNEGGWDDDDDDDDGKDKDTKEDSQAELEKLKAAATGKSGLPLLEGMDDGVLGQEWVQRTLQAAGEWPPPDLGVLDDLSFVRECCKDDTLQSPLNYAPLCRMLCMISGRLNSQMLNSHPELLKAGMEKKIDQTYFSANLTFRHRIGLLLEAVLRVAITLRSYQLVKTTVEAVAIFKIGCKVGSDEWFAQFTHKQYGCTPKLEIRNTTVETTDENEDDKSLIATGDVARLGFEMERTHAENFLRQKIAMYQKQGIPPQVGLQQYREGWWLLMRRQRLEGAAPATKESLVDREDKSLQQLHVAEEVIALFDEKPIDEQLVSALPLIIGNVAQKTIQAKVPFKIPTTPGKYKFIVELKSHDFLGADATFEVDVNVVDSSTITRKPKTSPEADATKGDDEPKKDK